MHQWLMSGPSGADEDSVIRSQPHAREVSLHVTELPNEFEVQRLGEHWLVAGPTGIFVVGRSEDDVVRAAAHTSQLAHDVRTALSEMVSWVPFVDALVVAHHRQLVGIEPHDLACTVVELDLLTGALTDGAVVVTPDDLPELYRLLPLAVSSLHHDGHHTLDPA